MIKRIYHPIGQGAFYSERHTNQNKDFNIVYDCGEWKNTRIATKLVKNSFNPDEEVSILFISHYDFDHVSKIDVLKSNFKIVNVVLPLLHNQEKILVSNFYESMGKTIVKDIVLDPYGFFGEKTKITFVKPTDNLKPPENQDTIHIDNLGKIISSHTIIKTYDSDWVYIPYNFEYKNRSKKLENLFKSSGLDIEKFKNDISYSTNPKNRAKIRKIYNKISGKINQNSMMVYSGPDDYNPFKRIYMYYRYKHLFYNKINNKLERVACVYTGDSDLNISNIRYVFAKTWKHVGTIQIPHHGDEKSFDSKVLIDQYYVCTISVGNTNHYKHPSPVVEKDIDLYKSIPLRVTEDPSTIYTEDINR